MKHTANILYRLFLSGTLLLFLLIGHANSQSKKSKPKPNIIVLMADDMGYGDVGIYGSKKIPTPNMDQFAGEGMIFTDAHAPGPTCTPSRYAFLTGQYFWRSEKTSVGGFGYATPRIEQEIQTLPDFLRKHGYHNAIIGKWHLGLDWGLQKGASWAGNKGEYIDYHYPITDGPLQHGFDYFFGLPGSLDMPPYVFIENNRTVGIPSLEKEPKNTLQWHRGGLMVPGWKDEDVGPVLTRKAVEFIRSHHKSQSDRPFFLYFAASAPHTPCVPPDFIKGKSLAGQRGDMVVEFDWSVGQIVTLLDELGIRNNTLVLVTSDNGALTVGPPHWGTPLDKEKYDVNHHGHRPNGVLRGQKADVWEGATRVPLLARWPGVVPHGSVNRDPVSLIDFYAGFAAILHDSAPESAIDSYNIYEALIGGKMDSNRILVHHSARGLFAIRQGSWKLINGRGSGGFTQPVEWIMQPGEPEGQLYNLDTDMSETKNLWSSHTEKVEMLLKLLNDYKK